MKIGFIGLGIMGKPMAKNLLKAGHELVVYDINGQAVKALAGMGAQPAENARMVAGQVDQAITMLPNSPQVREVVMGENGLIKGVRPGATLIDMSSIAPLVSREISAALAEKGAFMLDAPVSGGEPKAIEGTLAIMVGGPNDVFERYRDVLSCMGASVTRVGDIGSGNMAKLANQIMVAANIAGMAEALALAAKSGVDPSTVYQAVRAGLAGSTVLDAKAPLALAGNFKPGFRIDLHIKDLSNVLDTAASVGAPVPLSEEIFAMMRELSRDGHGADDHGGLIQYYEKHAGTTVRSRPEWQE